MEPKWLRKAQRDVLIQNPVSYLNSGFHNLITTSIPLIIQSLGPVSCVMYGLRYEVSFSDICVYNDGTYLSECFKHNLTYHVPIVATMRLSVGPLLQENGEEAPEIISSLRMPIFYLPLITGPNPLRCSALQDPDPQSQAIESGIFVIEGHMHTCPGTKTMINNTMLLLDTKTTFMVQVRSSHEGNRTIDEGNPFRGTSSMDLTIVKVPKRVFSEGAIVCSLPFSRKRVLVGILAQALGCKLTTFLQLVRCVSGVDYDATLFRIYEIHIEHRTGSEKSQTNTLQTLSRSLLKTEIFPHLNVMYEKNDQEHLYVLKVFYLAIATSMCILFAAGKIKETSRDLWQFASIQMPSARIGKLIKDKIKDHKDGAVNLLRRRLKNNDKRAPEARQYPDLRNWWAETRLSERIRSPIATGNFGRHGQYSNAQKGITLPLVDNNPMGVMNQLQRTSASMRRTDGINIAPRKLPKDAFRGPCGGHTPEGKSVGLVTSWACLTRLTIDIEDPKSLVYLVELTLERFLMSIFNLILPSNVPQQQSMEHGATEMLSVQLFEHISFADIQPDWYIFINNCGIPTHFVKPRDLPLLVKRFREARRKACIPRHCFLRIIHNPRQIRVICEAGQVISPLIVLDNLHKLKPNMSFQELITHGIVEYVSIAEEYSICKIALSLDDLRHAVRNNQHQDITHLEFDPAAFLGLVGASVVFATSQPGARTSYAIHQWKAIMCAGAKPFRGNILSSELMYNSAKLVHTRVASMCPLSKDGYGVEVLCALIPNSKNQEDPFVNHKQATQRGLFHALTTRYYFSEIHAPTVKTSERFEKPQDVLSKKENFSYDAIDEKTGLTKPNWYIPGGHPIFAKTRIVKRPYQLTLPRPTYTHDQKDEDDGEQKDNSNKRRKISGNTSSSKVLPKNVTWRREVGVCTQPDESGITHSVDLFATRTGIGLRSSVVTSREMDEGNKITNDGANKGTNSDNRSSKDMYWNEITGEIIDLVAAPTSIISRMLMSTMLEGFIGHAVTLNGDLKFGVDEQLFDGKMRDKLELAAEVFVRCGKKRSGGAILRCGKTGERLKSDIAELVVYYKPLLHLAEKKLQYRSTGPRHTLTRQPLTGRRKKGANRFGELESASTSAQGAAAVLLGRLRDLSDPFEIFVCSKCSTLASGNKFINYAWCAGCQRRDTVYIVKIAFIFLFNYYERLAMGHKTLIHIKPHNHRLHKSHSLQTASFTNLD